MTITAGIEFIEVMSGHISTATTGARLPADYATAEAQGKADGASLRLDLTIRAENVDAFLADSAHRASIHGTVLAPSIAPAPMTVTEGAFDCLSPDSEHAGTKNMWYRLALHADDGSEYFLEGYKVISPGFVGHLWPQTTTLCVTLHIGGQASDPVLAQGIVRVHARDFAKQLTTLHAVNARDRSEARRATVAFTKFFAANMVETYGGAAAPTRRGNGMPPDREKRPLRAPAPEVHPVRAGDGTMLRLTRYRGGDKGPVMLLHGLGVSSLVFSIDTIETNLVEFLVAHGYDVWLLDYRASIELEHAGTQFTADDVARHDYPAAVAEIRSVTGQQSIQVFAHCYGSTTFFMAMLTGLDGVRAAVCSQIGAHVLAARPTRVKAGLHIDSVLDLLRLSTMTAKTPDGGRGNHLLDDALRLQPVPAGEACRSEVCHRITFLYGLLYRHANLNAATHDALHEMFGVASVGALNHLATMVRTKHIVDADGNNAYLPEVERLAIPLSIVHGANNRCYRPESTERTIEWLAMANGAGLYDRRVIPGYGHVDCIFGRDAAHDVFPYIVERLDLTARA